jgi:hypothetical protein
MRRMTLLFSKSFKESAEVTEVRQAKPFLKVEND